MGSNNGLVVSIGFFFFWVLSDVVYGKGRWWWFGGKAGLNFYFLLFILGKKT